MQQVIASAPTFAVTVTDEVVMTPTSQDYVPAPAAATQVVASCLTAHAVVSNATGDPILASAAQESVISRPSANDIVATSSVDRVCSIQPNYHVSAGCSSKDVLATRPNYGCPYPKAMPGGCVCHRNRKRGNSCNHSCQHHNPKTPQTIHVVPPFLSPSCRFPQNHDPRGVGVSRATTALFSG